jgi:glucose 1-dehydrogenase
MKMLNKVVFLTDADCDSGQAIIARLSDEGASFILNSASDGSQLLPLLQLCQEKGRAAHVVNLDLTSLTQMMSGLEEPLALLGSIDVLIVNNNLVIPVSVETCDEEVFQHLLDVNAKSAFVCTQAVSRQMMEQLSGKVIYVGSIHAEKPTGSSFAYSAAKGAVQMLSREASLTLGRYGVQVNHIMMGPVDGDQHQFYSEISPLYEDYEYKVPNAVLGTNQDLANLVLFLSSDESGYLNGADIRLDGGFLNHYLDPKMKKPLS